MSCTFVEVCDLETACSKQADDSIVSGLEADRDRSIDRLMLVASAKSS